MLNIALKFDSVKKTGLDGPAVEERARRRSILYLHVVSVQSQPSLVFEVLYELVQSEAGGDGEVQ